MDDFCIFRPLWATAASALRSMLLPATSAGVLHTPTPPSAPVTPQTSLRPETRHRTCRSTASWSRPISTACRADSASETRDQLRRLSIRLMRHLRTSRADTLHYALPSLFVTFDIYLDPFVSTCMETFTIQMDQNDHFSNKNHHLGCFWYNSDKAVRAFCGWPMMLMKTSLLFVSVTCLTATVAAVMPTDDFRPDNVAHLVSSSDQMSALARGLVSGRNLHSS